MIFSGFWWKNSLEQIVGSSDLDTFAMDPPILVSWFGWLLLDSRSGKEEEQMMEFRNSRKDLTRLKNLKTEVAEIRILLEADLTSS